MYLFGGGHHRKKIKPQYTGLATQTSTTTIPIAIGFGKNRAAPNIIWQGDFQSHKQYTKTGKGFGSKTLSGYTYSGSFVLALGWGPVTNIDKVWKDQSKPTFASLGMTLIAGNVPQAPWGYLTSNHPTQALGYNGLALACVSNYDLGQSNTLAQHSFEVEWPLLNTAPGGNGDADPAQCIDKFLNSSLYGAIYNQPALPVEMLFSTSAATTTGDQAFQTYCKALGLGMSPLLDSQEAAGTVLERWALLFNTALCWTGYSLKFLPYGSETVTGNGVTYLPSTSAVFNFADADFLANGTDDPIIVRRKAPADAYNCIHLEFKNRANEYNVEPAPWHDQGLIDSYGLNVQSATTAHEICDPTVAATCAQLVGQRTAYVRNEYEFVVSFAKMQLTTGDIGTITDPQFGTLNVMITSIQEQAGGKDKGARGFRVVAEEYAASLGALGTFPVQSLTNTPLDTEIAPAAVNAPMILEPPSTLAGSVAQVWFAVSAGPSGAYDPNWGGCYVWLSSDNVTYQQVGTVDTPARMGTLTTTLAAYASANPDTVDSFGVDLTESNGVLQGVTAADAANAVTLFAIKDAGGTVEYGSYRDATQTATNKYTLGGQLYRGLYGSTGGSHAVGAAFARLDENIFKFDLPAEYIGKTIYAKFQSFNAFGGTVVGNGLQDLSTCTAYSYSPIGTGYGGGAGGVPTTPAAPTVSAQTGYNLVTWTASPANDNVIRYDVYRANGTGAAFGSATKIGSSTGTSYTDNTVTAAAPYTYFIVAVNAIGNSVNSPGTSITSATGSGAGVLRLYGGTTGRQPDAGEVLFELEMVGGENFAAGLPLNVGGCDVAPTGAISCPIKVNGTSVGSMNIAAGATTATWTMASSYTAAAHDKLRFEAPASQDATLSGLFYTFVGGR